jgi:hypothetical protein
MRAAVLALATSLALIANAKAEDLRIIAVASNQTGGDMLLTDSHCDTKPGLAVLSTDSYGDIQAAGCATRTGKNGFRIAWDSGEISAVPYTAFSLTGAGDQYAQIGQKLNTADKRIAQE